MIAYLFGTTRSVEVYFAALGLQASLFALTQSNQLTEMFLPNFHQIEHRDGSQNAMAAFSAVLNWMVLAVAGVVVILVAVAPWLIQLRVPGFTQQDFELGAAMVRVLVPLVILQISNSMLTMLAHAKGWYGATEGVQVIARLVQLAALISTFAHLGVWSLIVAFWLGQVIHFAGNIAIVRRFGYRHSFRLRHGSYRVDRLFQNIWHTFSYTGATQLYAFAFDAGLSFLSQGTYAVFKYVTQIYLKSNGILLRPVTIVFYTDFSQAVAAGATDVKKLARRALELTLALTVTGIVAMAAGGYDLLAGLWPRFTPDEIQMAYLLLCFMYSLLLVSALGQVGRKMALCVGLTRETYVLASAIQIVSAVCAYFVIRGGDAWGAAAMVGLNMLLLSSMPWLLLLLNRREYTTFYPWNSAWRWLCAAVVSGICGWYVPQFLHLSFLAVLPQALQHLTMAAIAATLAVSVLLVAAYLIGVSEVQDGWQRLGRFWLSRKKQLG